MITLTRAQFNSIVEHSKKCLPNEACGMLGGLVEGEDKTVEKIYFLENIDQSPEHFSMEPREQFAAVKDMRSNGWKLLGNFHSHPSSPSRPSEEDKKFAIEYGKSYLILSLATQEPVLNSFALDADGNLDTEILIVK